MEVEDRVLVLKRIHVRYRLHADDEHTAAARRAHDAHHGKCPVYRSIEAAIAVTTELDIGPPGLAER